MRLLSRIGRHARISWKNLCIPSIPSPPFLIFFISSICNLRCGHCFYWKSLNRNDDLTMKEIITLSRDLGRIENLYLSGGEPFIREEIAEICHSFIQNNKVEQIYVPTNAFFTDKIVRSVGKVLQEQSLKIFAIEISLDGMSEYHNHLRGSDRSFQKAMETYEALAELQRKDSRLRIHAVSTATADNLDEIHRLTTYLYEKCPAMDHHNIALIRGDRKNPSLQGPNLIKYQDLVTYIARVWIPRERGRFGGIVEPMLQWAKVYTSREQRQVVPCRAGILSGVIYANGDVSVCESLPPLGNLRQTSFKEIWWSKQAEATRRSIHKKECYCTNEIFLWPSIIFQPFQLTKAMLYSKVWKKPVPLKVNEN